MSEEEKTHPTKRKNATEGKIRAETAENPPPRNGMRYHDKRSPLGRQLLSKTAKRQTQEIQRLRRIPRPMRNQTRRDDLRKESGDCRGKGKTKRERRLTAPSKFKLND